MVLIKEIMSKTPHVIRSDMNLMEVCKLMKEADTGFLPVSQNGEKRNIIGVITDRDLCIRAGAQAVDFKSAKVSEFLSKDIHFVCQNEDVGRAAQLMKECKCRRVLVFDDEKSKNLLGVLSLGDLAVVHENEKLIFETLKEIYHAQPTPA